MSYQLNPLLEGKISNFLKKSRFDVKETDQESS